MSRNNLKQEAESFRDHASWMSEVSSHYLIDYLFPAMGIIDLLTSHLRGNVTLTADDKRLIFQISSFLSEYVSRCWEAAGLEVQVNSDENGTLISILGLDVKPIHLNSTFALMLSSLPKEMYLSRTTAVPMTAQGDYVCTFIQGFLRGVYFEDKEDVNNLFGDDLNASLDKVIALQYAKWHELVFPSLTIAHLPELYLSCLKNKHFLASDMSPMHKEVDAFFAYFKSLNIDPAMAGRKLATIFLSSPSEYLSVLGLALLGGFDAHDTALSVSLPAVYARSFATPLMRNAYYHYRSLIGKDTDWIGLDVVSDAHVEMFEQDLKIGFLPWVKLNPRYVLANIGKDAELRKFFSLVKDGGFFLAQDLLDKILENSPGNLDLRVQRAFFLYVTKDLDLAHEYCKRLLSEHDIERHSEFFSAWGSILLEMNQIEVAIRYLKLAYNSGDQSKFRKAAVGNNLAWCYIISGMNADAKAILDEIIDYPCLERVSILLNLLFISEKTSIMGPQLLEALKLAPMDRRVFNNMIMQGKSRIVKGELSF
jgi:tetratricopeptide (TPR) repeat protein